MLNYYRIVTVAKEDYDAAEEPKLWESFAEEYCATFGLAVNIPEQDNKFRIVYLNNNVLDPAILSEIDAYLEGVMNFSRICGEDIIVVERQIDRCNVRKIYDLINAGEFYEAYHREEFWD